MMKRYAMIGAPVTTVRTPPLLVSFLAQLGVDAEIETRHVEPQDLANFMQSVSPAATIDGLLVTMPHKNAIMAHLEAVSSVALQAGSVNVVKRLASGKLVGAQFDGMALVDVLISSGVPLGDARVLLAGVGGAGLAISQAIAGHGCKILAVTETNADLRDAAIAMLRAQSDCPVAAYRAEDRVGFDLLINATPMGMRADDPSPFDSDLVKRAGWVADIVADPPQTRLAAMADDAGVPLITGRNMVGGQVALIGRWLISPDIEQ